MIGGTIVRREVVTSTNDVARELADRGADEGTAVVAAEQTGGRGSRGRVWISPAGLSLLVSIILRPKLPAGRIGELAFVAAVAVAGALRHPYALDAGIKWPNDVLVHGRKIAGILVEAARGAAIVGIGVNVNWTDVPEEIALTATSIALELGRPVDIEGALKSLLAELDIAYGVYRARGFSRTLSDWKALEVTTGKPVTALLDGLSMEGVAVDVDEHGNLIVELPTGERRAISAATVLNP